MQAAQKKLAAKLLAAQAAHLALAHATSKNRHASLWLVVAAAAKTHLPNAHTHQHGPALGDAER